MVAKRNSKEARYLQEQGLSIRNGRTNRAKPRRGTIPMVMVEGDWEPLIQEHSVVQDRINALLADPQCPRLRQLLAARQPLEAEPELLFLYSELCTACAERIRIDQAIASFWKDAPTIAQVPMAERPQAHPWTALAMQLLVGLYTGKAPTEVAALVDGAKQREIVRHFHKVFGVRVGHAWALAFVDEVHKAALERQSAELRETNLDGEQLERFDATQPPMGMTAHAELVLKRCAEAMSEWAVRFDLPTWLDAKLTTYFIGRYGFDRGGGAGRKISRATLLKLLTNPKALEKDLSKSRAAKAAFATQLVAVRRRESITAYATPMQ